MPPLSLSTTVKQRIIDHWSSVSERWIWQKCKSSVSSIERLVNHRSMINHFISLRIISWERTMLAVTISIQPTLSEPMNWLWVHWVECEAALDLFPVQVGSQCFFTHLTTFAGGFIVLPAPVNWNYVFENLDFSKNKTIYFTVICLVVLNILFTIYARYKEKKDMEKVRRLTVLNDSSFSLVGSDPDDRQ